MRYSTLQDEIFFLIATVTLLIIQNSRIRLMLFIFTAFCSIIQLFEVFFKFNLDKNCFSNF